MTSLISAETMREHRATWWVYAGSEKIRRQATMRGSWGYDLTCSCGWETNTGGGVRRYLEDKLWDHRYEAQREASLAARMRATMGDQR